MPELKLKQSPFLSLKARDFLRGALIAVLTAVAASVNEFITQNGTLNMADLWLVGKAASFAFIAYLGKNFFTKPDKPAASQPE